MNYTLKMTLLILAITFMQSCKKKDDELPSLKEDYSFFLNTREYMFRGTLPDSSVFWKYGLFEFQRGAGSILVGSSERPQKSLSFDLVSNKDLSTRIDITTPSYDVQFGELFSKTVAEGQKEIGGRYNKFELALTLNKKFYTTNGDQTKSKLMVLKMEKTKDEFDRDVVLVWFKVNCTFYSTIDTSSFTLKDGYLIAGFMYNL